MRDQNFNDLGHIPIFFFTDITDQETTDHSRGQ